jgi:SAM-dependent methyltransferase
MKVLDVGSGAGDVAFVAGELVGSSGSVIGVDQNPAVLEVARERAMTAGRANVRFVQGEAAAVDLPNDFDAVVGRLVLMHVAEPRALLLSLVGHLKAGGVVAFAEPDCTLWLQYAMACPGALTMRQVCSWVVRCFERTGVNPRIGPELAALYRSAGLVDVALRLYAPMGDGPDWPGYEWVIQGMRSVLPAVEKFGIATAEEVGLETLGERLRAESKAPVMLPPHVSAWARKP